MAIEIPHTELSTFHVNYNCKERHGIRVRSPRKNPWVTEAVIVNHNHSYPESQALTENGNSLQ